MESFSHSEDNSSEDEMPVLPLAESLPHGGEGLDYGDDPPVLFVPAEMEESFRAERQERVKVQSMVEALNAAIGTDDSFSDDFLNISGEEPEEPKPRINKENNLLTVSPSCSGNIVEPSFDILEALTSDIDMYSQFSVSEIEYNQQAVVTAEGLTRKELESFEGLSEQLKTYFRFERTSSLNPKISGYSASQEVKVKTSQPFQRAETPVSLQSSSNRACNTVKDHTTAVNNENEKKGEKLFDVSGVSRTDHNESERRKKARREELQCSLGSYWKINESTKGDDCAPRPKRPNAGAKLKALTQNEAETHKGIDFENRMTSFKSTTKSSEMQKSVSDRKIKSQYRVLPYERPVTRGVVRKEDRINTSNATSPGKATRVYSRPNIGRNSSNAFGSDVQIIQISNQAESSAGCTRSKDSPVNGNTVVITLNQAVATALKVPDSFTTTPQSEFIAKMKMKLVVQESHSKMDFATAYQKAKSLNLIHDEEPGCSPAATKMPLGRPAGSMNLESRSVQNQIPVSSFSAKRNKPASCPTVTVAQTTAKAYSSRVKPVFKLPSAPEPRPLLFGQQFQRTHGVLSQARGWSENRKPRPPLLNTPERLAILRHFEQARRLAESGRLQVDEHKLMPTLRPSPEIAKQIQGNSNNVRPTTREDPRRFPVNQSVKKIHSSVSVPSVAKNSSSNKQALKVHLTNIVVGSNRAGKKHLPSKQPPSTNRWIDEPLPLVFKLSNNKLLIGGNIITIDCTKLITEGQVPLRFDPEVIVEVNDSDNLPDATQDTDGCRGLSHCNLGCICESLNFKRGDLQHCGKAKCVLGCICGTKKIDPGFNDCPDIRSRLRPRDALCNWRNILRAGEGKEIEEEPMKVGHGRAESKAVAEVVNRRRCSTGSRSVDESLKKRPRTKDVNKTLNVAESPLISQSVSPMKIASDSPQVIPFTVPEQKISSSEPEVESEVDSEEESETELDSEMEAEWEADMELERKIQEETQRKHESKGSELESVLEEPEFEEGFDSQFDPESKEDYDPGFEEELHEEIDSEYESDSENNYSLLRSLNGCTPCVVKLVDAPLSKPLSEIELICASDSEKLKLEHEFSVQTLKECHSHICAQGDIPNPINFSKSFSPAAYYRQTPHIILTDSTGEFAGIIEWDENKAEPYPSSRVVVIGEPGLNEEKCTVVSLVPPEDGYEWILYSVPVLPCTQGRIYLERPRLTLPIKKLLQKQEQAATERVICRLLPPAKSTRRCHPHGGLYILPDLPKVIIYGPSPIGPIIKPKNNRIRPPLPITKSQESRPSGNHRPVPQDVMKQELSKYIIKFVPISTTLPAASKK